MIFWGIYMKKAIVINNLWSKYDENWVLKNIYLKIYRGESVGLVGPTGSGKTTLAKHILGLLKPIKGRVIVDGIDVSKTSASKMARIVGYLFQNPSHQIFSETVYDEIAFGLKNFGIKNIDERVRSMAETMGLIDKLEESPFNLSIGERERVAIASILVLDPKILILDEPTIGQDYKNYILLKFLLNRLRERGKTIILISHDMELILEHCDRIIALKNGEILYDGDIKIFFNNAFLLKNLNLDLPPLLKFSKKYGLNKFVRNIDELIKVLKNEARPIC
ncbi:MAG: ABC transporter ATP-binding protein [Thermoprotei archaeon]|nr:MAG: ABC transporter ATP-binding protein [Thermoprotei archaeon]